MQLYPSFDRFSSLAAGANLVPVWREFLFDVDTAVTAYAKLAEEPFGFLLESVVGGEQWARYSFMGTRPRSAWRMTGAKAEEWTPQGGWKTLDSADPLGDLDRRLRRERPVHVPGLPRFWGGAVGYFGYDVVRSIERLPDPPPDDLGLSITVVEIPSEPNRIEIANIFTFGGMDTCVHPSVPGTRQRVKCEEIIYGRDEVEAFVQKGGDR